MTLLRNMYYTSWCERTFSVQHWRSSIARSQKTYIVLKSTTPPRRTGHPATLINSSNVKATSKNETIGKPWSGSSGCRNTSYCNRLNVAYIIRLHKTARWRSRKIRTHLQWLHYVRPSVFFVFYARVRPFYSITVEYFCFFLRRMLTTT